MANAFQRGDFLPITFQATGGTATRVDIKNHTIDISSMTYDVTHTGHNGIRARIAGLEDAKGTISASFDLDLPPYGTTPFIRHGVSGLCLFYVDISLVKHFQIPVIIPKTHYESGVESEMKYSFDVEMNRLAGLPAFPAL